MFERGQFFNEKGEFDRKVFRKVLNLNALLLENPKDVSSVQKYLSKKNLILSVPRVKHLIKINDKCAILLKESSMDASNELKDLCQNELKKVCQNGGFQVVPHQIILSYEYFSKDEVLEAVIPDHVEVPSAFETIGHILHLNLGEAQLPFKEIIGQVLLDKVARTRTVVNKTGLIQNEFRVFPMEVIAGESDMIVEVSESDCRFKFDFSKVYWNSRLQTEHKRLVSQFKEGQYICDLFCGIGPFAIPAAKKGCKIFANDLNPDSYRYLMSNIKANKVSENICCASNANARDFMPQALETLREKHGRSDFDHYIMNLPASSIEFLDIFQDVQKGWVHCYCFAPKKGFEDDIIGRASATLDRQINNYVIHRVRNVAPNKEMFCFSFQLQNEIKRRRLVK